MKKSPIWLNPLLLILFAALSYIGLVHHELCLDEANDWLMARDSNSLTELLHNGSYAGHPPLWSILLHTLSRFTSNPISMQLVHLSISIIATWLFLKHSPFSTPVKVCTIFGYYFLFEYNLINRSYNITWLLLIIFCILFNREKRNYFLLTLTFVVLANIHAFSWLIALVLFCITIHSCIKENTGNRKNVLLYCVLFAIGAAISVQFMLPPTDVHLYQQIAGDKFISGERISKTVSFLFKGLYPLPDIASHNFWNTNFIITHCKIVSIVLTPLLFIIPFILFHNKPYSLAAFYISAFLIMAFIFRFELFTGVHYMGHAFILLMVSLWLASSAHNKIYSVVPLVWTERFEKWRTLCYTPFLASIMACQLIAGIFTFGMDYKYPFSEGKEVAGYIKSNSDNNNLLIIGPFYAGPSIAVYTDRFFFYPDNNCLSTFTDWNTAPIDGNETWKRIEYAMNSSTATKIIIALAYDGDTLKDLQQSISALGSPYSIKETKEFNKGIVAGENYVVYVIEKKL